MEAPRDGDERERRADGDLRKLLRAIEQAPMSILIADASGVIEYVNPRFSQLTGYAAAEVLGKPVSAFESASWAHVTRSEEWQGELQSIRRTGEPYWERVVVSPIRDDAGRITHRVLMSKDITEEKRAQAELVRVQEQLLQSQKLEALGRLAGGVAHDFNNLLTVICGITSDVIDRMGAESPFVEDLAAVVTAGEKAAALTEQLLAFSRQQPRNPRVIDFVRVVHEAASMLRRLLREDIQLHVRVPDCAIPVLVDPEQMHQVLLNLAINARDAMPRGGELFIEVCDVEVGADEVAEPGRYAELRVRDTGVGIAPENMSRVFEPFFTTKERGRGTGLGLPTVLGIVRQSGGEIGIESEPSVGTTVRIVLPRVSARPVEEAQRRDGALLQGRETVLVAEDDPQVRGTLARMLSRCGYEVLLAANGREALAIVGASKTPIALVITDVVMPGLSGVQLARSLRTIRPAIRIVFTTGFSDVSPEEREELATAPMLRKPFTQRAVATVVRAALDDA